MLSMFRFFPLNVDGNPKTLDGKCSEETLKLNEETKKDTLQMCSNIEKYIYLKKVTAKKIQIMSI